MAKLHLHELLKEEQEPFVLKTYINERRTQLSKPALKLHHLKRTRPSSQNPTFPRNLCKSSCLSPSNVVKTPPTFDFPSPVRTPCRKSNNVAALILEAAFRIQEQQKSPKNLSFGFLASILRRVSLKRKTQKREICGERIRVSVKDILRWDSFHGLQRFGEERPESAQKGPKQHMGLEKDTVQVCFSSSGESSSCSEDFEEKSMDLESSCSGSSGSDDFQEMEFGGERTGDSRPCEKGFCSSPIRFRVPECFPDSGSRAPGFVSPAMSHLRGRKEVMDSHLFQSASNDGGIRRVDPVDEEKDQFSPVSVLDPPFEDDDVNEDEDDEVFEKSLTNVQRSKQNLLSKIWRFERLAELDSLELEKRIAEEEEAEFDDDNRNDVNVREAESPLPLENGKSEQFVREVLRQSSTSCSKIRSDMKHLVLDLAKEEAQEDLLDVEVLTKVCKRIESWNEVAFNTIDMTVELDLIREDDEWRRNHEEIRGMAVEIESAIFSLLVKELSMDLVQSSYL